MRLGIFSDLHLECFPEGRVVHDETSDVIVLAGDISVGTAGLFWASRMFPDSEIIYVPGNHEYYDGIMSEMRMELESCAQSLGIHLLDNRAIELNGVQFLGSTLWADYQLYTQAPYLVSAGYDIDRTLIKAQAYIPDYKYIKQSPGEMFTIADSIDLHLRAIQWLQQMLSEPFDGKRVVISHHAPLADCIPKQFKGDLLSPAFASNLEHLLVSVDLWIHGHVHDPVDLSLGKTRVVANPGGYPHEIVHDVLTESVVIKV